MKKILMAAAIMMPVCIAAMDGNEKKEITPSSGAAYVTREQLVLWRVIGAMWRFEKPIKISECESSTFETYELEEPAPSAITTRKLTIIKNPDGGMMCHEYTSVEPKPQGQTSWIKKRAFISAAKEVMWQEEDSSSHPDRTKMIIPSGGDFDFVLWKNYGGISDR